MRRTLVVFLLLSTRFASLLFAEPERPVAIVQADSDAQLIISGRNSRQTLRAGMVLFTGDVVLTRDQRIELEYCPKTRRYSVAAGSLVQLSDSDVTVHSGNASAGQELSVCTLPKIEREPMATTIHDSGVFRDQPPTREARIASLDPIRREALNRSLAAAVEAPEILRRIANAVAFEDSGLLFDAIEEYRDIQSLWKSADWTESAIAKLNGRVLADMAPRRAGPATAPAPAPQDSDKILALLIGISRYRSGNGVVPLRFADRDAQLFRDFLKSPRGGKVPDENIWLLLDERATRDAIDNALNEILASNAGRRNTLVLFVAAHGRYICTERDPAKPRRYCNPGDKDEKAFVLTHDSNPEDPKLSGYAMDTFYDRITFHADVFERVLVYVDVCHAGFIGRLPERTQMPGQAVRDVFTGAKGDLGMLMATPRYKGKRALREEELAYESKQYGGGHGIFTYFVIDGLNKQVAPRPEGMVAFEDLAAHVEIEVRKATQQRQLPTRLLNAPRIPVVANPLEAGIELAGITAGPVSEKERRGTEVRVVEPDISALFEELNRTRDIHGESADQYIREKNRVRVALEEAGQTVLLDYLKGDQNPVPMERFQYCARVFELALTLAPHAAFDRSRQLFCEGRALIFDRRYEEAERLLESSIRIDPERAYSYNALGIAALEQVPKDAAYLDRAIRAFEDARRFAPYWAYPLHNLALAQAEKGEFEMAMRSYREAMRLAPDYSYLPYNLGLIYQRLNRIGEARGEYSRALQIAEQRREQQQQPTVVWPESAEPLNALATLEMNDKDWSQAERLYTQARERAPENPTILHNYALLLSGPLKRMGEAETIWRGVLAKDPKHEAAHLGLAEALAAAGRGREAIKEFQGLLDRRPDFVAVHRSLAILYIRAGEPLTAREQLRGIPSRDGTVLFAAELADIDRVLAGREPQLKDIREAWRSSRR